MMFPSVANLAPDRPGAEADPEMNEPPCTLALGNIQSIEAGQEEKEGGDLPYKDW